MTTHHAPAAFQHVNFGHKSLAEYRSTLVPGMYDEIVQLGKELKGARVLHLSATAYGGGVAEIMYTLMPLMEDAGLKPEWSIIYGADEFYEVTKLMHNSLQGDPRSPSPEQWDIWRRYQEINANLFDANDYDVVFVHDPQPAGLARICADADTEWVWRCHIDLSEPNPDMIEKLLPELEPYGASFFHRQEYVPSKWLGPKPSIIPPAIDPLAPKNMALAPHDAAYIVRQFGIDIERPLMVQVSRFDPWKDPLGVVDAWRIAREEVPGLQLALVGSLAADDPEGVEYLERTIAHVDGEPDAFILTNLQNVGAVEVNAFQVMGDVVMQKSTKEGFGLTVSEALWKARPMVAGNVGGIRSQIEHGKTGYLVDTVEEAAQASIEILREPDKANDMARAGKEFVREHFLTPRYLRDHLRCYKRLLNK